MVRFLFWEQKKYFSLEKNRFLYPIPLRLSNSLRTNNFETDERWCIQSCKVGQRLVEILPRWLMNIMNRWTWFHYRNERNALNDEHTWYQVHCHFNHGIELQLLQYFEIHHRFCNVHLKFILPKYQEINCLIKKKHYFFGNVKIR